MIYTRRELGKLMLTTLPVAGLMPREVFAGWQAKPNSKFAGVQIGMNTPYNYASGALARTMSADETLQKTVQLGVNAIELRSQPIELAMGAPAAAVAGGRGDAAKVAAEQLREWRLKADPKKAADVRKKYEDAGVHIEVVKYDGIYDFADAETDYAFALAKAAGARAISCELDLTGKGSKRLGPFADKHQLMVGYHGHHLTTPEMYAGAVADAKYNGMNIDIGHWIAGNFGSPIEFIRKHHARITHIHVKDRKKDQVGGGGQNVPFGQGDTPIKEVLQLIRDNKWPIQATIEFEYAVPEGSDRMAEIAKCVQYCKDALMAKA
jgi:sugar phosphate isomerase/epimerase